MFTSILVFILVLSILVLVHEAGHFFAAKKAGILVEEFGFGIPPRIYGKKVGETIYSINLLPFGGFVRLHGENTEDTITKPKRAFLNKSKKVRALIVTAGVIMNFVLAIFAFGIVYSFTGVPVQTDNVSIVEINKGSPAASSDLKPGDIVKQVNGEDVKSTNEFISILNKHLGQSVTLSVERDSAIKQIEVNLRSNPGEDQGALGVVISSSEVYYPPLWKRPFLGVYYGFREAIFWGGIVIAGLVHIFSQLIHGTVPQDVAGPVGIYALTTEAAQLGVLTLVNFVGVLSVNLAILNIFPFPALDGGRLLFIGIEAILGRKVVPKVESLIHTVGMVILLLLILAITFYDVRRLIEAGGIQGFLQNVTQQQ
jgi:regulator of sigma E protease